MSVSLCASFSDFKLDRILDSMSSNVEAIGTCLLDTSWAFIGLYYLLRTLHFQHEYIKTFCFPSLKFFKVKNATSKFMTEVLLHTSTSIICDSSCVSSVCLRKEKGKPLIPIPFCFDYGLWLCSSGNFCFSLFAYVPSKSRDLVSKCFRAFVHFAHLNLSVSALLCVRLPGLISSCWLLLFDCLI